MGVWPFSSLCPPISPDSPTCTVEYTANFWGAASGRFHCVTFAKSSSRTEADKENQFQIAGRSYSGSAVYDLLKTYKDEARSDAKSKTAGITYLVFSNNHDK